MIKNSLIQLELQDFVLVTKRELKNTNGTRRKVKEFSDLLGRLLTGNKNQIATVERIKPRTLIWISVQVVLLTK